MSITTAREYPEELAVGYYLDNFQKILDFVDRLPESPCSVLDLVATDPAD